MADWIAEELRTHLEFIVLLSDSHTPWALGRAGVTLHRSRKLVAATTLIHASGFPSPEVLNGALRHGSQLRHEWSNEVTAQQALEGRTI